MSLKAFHILFMVMSLALAMVCVLWGIQEFRTVGGAVPLWIAGAALLAIPAIGVYGLWFLRKTKDIGYL